VTFVDWDDMPRWGLINKALGLSYPEPVETYSSSPHLFEELDIPAGTKGRLPRDKRTLAGVDAEVLEDLGETGKKNSRSGGDSGRGRTGRDGGRDGGREGARRGPKSGDAPSREGDGEGGRSRTRRRRPSEGDAAPAEGSVQSAEPQSGQAQSGEGADKPSRARRSRTRRRNGEVVSASGASGESTEA
jgi:hypothetical protein